MAPFYRGFTTKVKLASDDIEAIQELYGEKTSEFVKYLVLCCPNTNVVKGCVRPGWLVITRAMFGHGYLDSIVRTRLPVPVLY